jgi:hypothetical protein
MERFLIQNESSHETQVWCYDKYRLSVSSLIAWYLCSKAWWQCNIRVIPNKSMQQLEINSLWCVKFRLFILFINGKFEKKQKKKEKDTISVMIYKGSCLSMMTKWIVEQDFFRWTSSFLIRLLSIERSELSFFIQKYFDSWNKIWSNRMCTFSRH